MNPKKFNTLDKEQVKKISHIHSSFWYNTIRLKLAELGLSFSIHIKVYSDQFDAGWCKLYFCLVHMFETSKFNLNLFLLLTTNKKRDSV